MLVELVIMDCFIEKVKFVSYWILRLKLGQ